METVVAVLYGLLLYLCYLSCEMFETSNIRFRAIFALSIKKEQHPWLMPSMLLLQSERGDSNARPLRPERSALPTALLSVLRVQKYK